jgi:G3E family GTPase
MMTSPRITNSPRIPTNLITGFLGVGKTTAILHLLRNKPADENWAVLVNEFGEIGIDGAILQQSGATIREVAGGCICCVANLPLQIGLNMLIAKARPDRLLIEPTGLGHPQNIVDLLTGDYYGNLLELQAIVALADARKCTDTRYTEHETFRDQLQIADLVIANKADQCGADDFAALDSLLAAMGPPAQVFARVEQGALAPGWLRLPHIPRGERVASSPAHVSGSLALNPLAPPPAPPASVAEGQRCVRREGRGLGHFSCGWLFAPDAVFDMNALFTALHGLPVQRLKGIVNTDRGAFIVNMENGVLSLNDAGAAPESRLEIIHSEQLPWQQVEDVLLGALSAHRS